jgi:enoyl-[acyl-carrier protein] reductase II
VKIVLLRQGIQNVDSLFKRKWYYRSTCGQQYPICIKSAKCGVDAIVAEGFEAGGHNGRDETTTFTLIPMVKSKKIPVIAAGGIANGRMLAAMALDGVQVGSRFAASMESSAHDNFKKTILETKEGGTQLTKELVPFG